MWWYNKRVIKEIPMTVQDLQDALLTMLTQSVPGTTHSQAIEALLEVLDVHQ
jgi:hypothetical protein